MDAFTLVQKFNSSATKYNEAVIADGNNIMITSDWELPDTDPRMLTLVCDMAREQKIRKLVIAGDLVATDQNNLNHWVDTYKEDYEMSFRTLVKMMTDILQWVKKDFDSIQVIRGNHDDRVAKATGGEVNLGMWLEMAGVPYSQYDHMYLSTRRGPVKVIHPRQYRANSLKLAQDFYTTSSFNGEKCHIVIGHTHQAQFGKSPDKLKDCVALGCLRDPERTKYASLNSTTLPPWDSGFLMIRDGFFHPVVMGQTDIGMYLPK